MDRAFPENQPVPDVREITFEQWWLDQGASRYYSRDTLPKWWGDEAFTSQIYIIWIPLPASAWSFTGNTILVPSLTSRLGIRLVMEHQAIFLLPIWDYNYEQFKLSRQILDEPSTAASMPLWNVSCLRITSIPQQEGWSQNLAVVASGCPNPTSITITKCFRKGNFGPKDPSIQRSTKEDKPIWDIMETTLTSVLIAMIMKSLKIQKKLLWNSFWAIWTTHYLNSRWWRWSRTLSHASHQQLTFV